MSEESAEYLRVYSGTANKKNEGLVIGFDLKLWHIVNRALVKIELKNAKKIHYLAKFFRWKYQIFAFFEALLAGFYTNYKNNTSFKNQSSNFANDVVEMTCMKGLSRYSMSYSC